MRPRLCTHPHSPAPAPLPSPHSSIAHLTKVLPCPSTPQLPPHSCDAYSRSPCPAHPRHLLLPAFQSLLYVVPTPPKPHLPGHLQLPPVRSDVYTPPPARWAHNGEILALRVLPVSEGKVFKLRDLPKTKTALVTHLTPSTTVSSLETPCESYFPSHAPASF